MRYLPRCSSLISLGAPVCGHGADDSSQGACVTRSALLAGSGGGAHRGPVAAVAIDGSPFAGQVVAVGVAGESAAGSEADDGRGLAAAFLLPDEAETVVGDASADGEWFFAGEDERACEFAPSLSDVHAEVATAVATAVGLGGGIRALPDAGYVVRGTVFVVVVLVVVGAGKDYCQKDREAEREEDARHAQMVPEAGLKRCVC